VSGFVSRGILVDGGEAPQWPVVVLQFVVESSISTQVRDPHLEKREMWAALFRIFHLCRRRAPPATQKKSRLLPGLSGSFCPSKNSLLPLAPRG